MAYSVCVGPRGIYTHPNSQAATYHIQGRMIAKATAAA
jgi:hypothetical protein